MRREAELRTKTLYSQSPGGRVHRATVPSRDSCVPLIREGGATQGSALLPYPDTDACFVHVLFLSKMFYKRKRTRSFRKKQQKEEGRNLGKGWEATHDCPPSWSLVSLRSSTFFVPRDPVRTQHGAIATNQVWLCRGRISWDSEKGLGSSGAQHLGKGQARKYGPGWTVGEKDWDTHPNYPGKRREILSPNASHGFKLVTQSQA